MADLCEREPGEFSRRLWWALFDAQLVERKHWRVAWSIAQRQAKLALQLLDGMQQREAAMQLGISERTAKSDAAALRAVERSGVLRRPTAGLPPVPRQPEDVSTVARRRVA